MLDKDFGELRNNNITPATYDEVSQKVLGESGRSSLSGGIGFIGMFEEVEVVLPPAAPAQDDQEATPSTDNY